MNKYFDDSKLFFRNSAKLVSENMDKADLVNTTMSFALAIERVLKGILFEVNPLYILMKSEFKNSIAAIYSQRIINSTREVTDSPDGDVITYRNSLLRAEVISDFAHKNKSLLFYLSECRDIIAHNELDHLDLDKISLMMRKDFYTISRQVSDVTGTNLRSLLSQQDNRLSQISAELQDSIPEKVDILLANHQSKWEVLRATDGYVEDKDNTLAQILRTPNKFSCECPACKKTAVLYTTPETEFNQYMNQEVVLGYFIKKLKCVYCKLDVTDYEHISYLEEKYSLQQYFVNHANDSDLS